jgi:tricorn protease
VGHYILAIDGEDVTTADNIYRLLQHKDNAVVTITYSAVPSPEDLQTYRVRTIGSENRIKYREWVNRNRAHVERASGGSIGYVHIPDMGRTGLIEFAKVYFPHYYRKGFILDDRHNGGGFTADMIIDRLERRLWGITQPREGGQLRDPERVFHGHLAVLINEDTGSCGEYFAQAIKLKGLAKIIGMRTWGGAIGIEPHQPMVDNGTVTPPQFGLYGLDRTWLIEGHGVDPDLEIQNMPGDVLRGQDAQLDTAIEYLMQMIREDPKAIPPPPEYPDKSKKA